MKIQRICTQPWGPGRSRTCKRCHESAGGRWVQFAGTFRTFRGLQQEPFRYRQPKTRWTIKNKSRYVCLLCLNSQNPRCLIDTPGTGFTLHLILCIHTAASGGMYCSQRADGSDCGCHSRSEHFRYWCSFQVFDQDISTE